MKFLRWVLVVTLLCAACASQGPEISGDLVNVGSVTTTFKVTPARAKVGQPVRFTIRLVNNAGTEKQLTFPSGQRYDFWAMDGDAEAWRWSDGQVFTQAVSQEVLGAQSGVTYGEIWRPERSGTYSVHGRLAAEGFKSDLTGELVVE